MYKNEKLLAEFSTRAVEITNGFRMDFEIWSRDHPGESPDTYLKKVYSVLREELADAAANVLRKAMEKGVDNIEKLMNGIQVITGEVVQEMRRKMPG